MKMAGNVVRLSDEEEAADADASNRNPTTGETWQMLSKINNPMAGEIWQTLSKINVSEHTETKGPMKLTYLSWTWAYSTMMEHFPQFKYIFSDNEVHADDSVTVHCHGFIGDVAHEMWLPVMNHKNQAISNPTARDISDTKMRCLVKCIAIFGLGLYVYAGEDLPADTAPKAAPKPVSKEKMEAIALTMNTFIEDVKDRDELKAYWKDNKQALKELEDGSPELFNVVLTNFKKRSKVVSES
jgi:hypothetical protein